MRDCLKIYEDDWFELLNVNKCGNQTVSACFYISLVTWDQMTTLNRPALYEIMKTKDFSPE